MLGKHGSAVALRRWIGRPAAPLRSPHDNDRILAVADGDHAGEPCEGPAGS
ncbi:hypothetical protein [Methanosphaerula palustris]|uniref:Uncharacterized protein n=1 Tax=Methanosphaerula palustris (strain ATCC BAA-1556 / DSM 19958 / E1-9c) TaxID=521011 RepID=B8GGL3_METPE|nr:hypothetical protein [Methanosphaerula palustris]ACL16268.1 hypothetical protein Mpal_0914 [Methanosphaerula palustris E1-9c]